MFGLSPIGSFSKMRPLPSSSHSRFTPCASVKLAIASCLSFKTGLISSSERSREAATSLMRRRIASLNARRRAADAGRLQNRGRQRRLAALSWSTPFSEPIELPNGRKLVTLEDAARYIQKLPKTEQAKPHWQHAVEHLINAAEREPAWLMFAHMGMLKALHHGVERVFNTNRKPIAKRRIGASGS
jgi:hypothetical protein